MSGMVDGKVVVVTGAASGLGRAAAVAFAREGASLALADIDVAGLAETADHIGGALTIETDVTEAAQVDAMVAAVVDRYGQLDCAFNNAGIEGKAGTTTIEYEEDDWDRVVRIDLKGVWLCMKYEIMQMLRQGGGSIVNTASIAGLVGLTGSSPYVAAKHGVVGLTKTAALEYARLGVRVNAVCPGVFDTPLLERILGNTPERKEMYLDAQPIGRLGEPEELAEAVVWLCSDAASFVTGQSMPVDGGYVAQ